MRKTNTGFGNDEIVTVCHTYYEKVVTAPLVFHTKGAHPWRSKLVTLGEEVRRRLRNMDVRHTLQDKLAVIGKFLQKMADSGYDSGTRGEVVKSEIKKYFREVNAAKKGGTSIYSSREEIEKKKVASKLLNRQWFKQRRGGSKER